MVAIAPVMKDIGRKLNTDDVRLPTAAEIQSLTAPSKSLTAAPSDVQEEDDRNPVLVGRRASTSEEISTGLWQSHEVPELVSDPSRVRELPSAEYNYQAVKSVDRIAGHDDNKTGRASPTSLNASTKNMLSNEKSNLPVPEENEPITEKPPMLPAASQPLVALMAEQTQLPREPQRAPLNWTPSDARTPIADRAESVSQVPMVTTTTNTAQYDYVERADILPGNTDFYLETQIQVEKSPCESPQARDRLLKTSSLRLWLRLISAPRRIWKKFEARILRIEYRRRREGLGSRSVLNPLLVPSDYHYRLDEINVRKALLKDIAILWYYVTSFLLYISYFIFCFPFILWVAHRHRNVLVHRRALEVQQRESIMMLGRDPSDSVELRPRLQDLV